MRCRVSDLTERTCPEGEDKVGAVLGADVAAVDGEPARLRPQVVEPREASHRARLELVFDLKNSSGRDT